MDSIGDTPLVHLGQMSPVGGVAIYLTLKYMNPTGRNVVGAIAIAQAFGPNDTVVAVACDTGVKYLSEGLFDA